MTEQSLAHTCWDCTYHIVWIPKYRRKVLYGECREELKGILRQLLEMKKIEIVEGSISKDHIHFVEFQNKELKIRRNSHVL